MSKLKIPSGLAIVLLLCIVAKATPDKPMNESRVIENVKPLSWGTGWECTFAGAIESMTAGTDHPVEYGTLLGETGLAFRTRWFVGDAGKQKFHPVSPVGEMPEEITAASKASGWPMSVVLWWDKKDAAKSPLRRIVDSIDAGRPVLCYHGNASGFDCAVILGYRDFGKTVLLYDYDGQTAPLAVPLEQLGFFFLFLDKPVDPLFPKDAFLQGLKIAATNWSRDDRPRFDFDGQFLFGRHAFIQWMKSLSTADSLSNEDANLLLKVSWWNFDSLKDARAAVVGYLRENSSLLKPEAEQATLRAADFYERENRLFAGVNDAKDCFFSPSLPDSRAKWTSDVRTREQQILLKAMRLEWHAQEQIKHALEVEKVNIVSKETIQGEALFDAVKKDDVNVVSAMLDQSPTAINGRDEGDGATPLHWAASVQMAELLLSRGAAIDALDEYHQASPVYWQLGEGKEAAANFLIAKGAKHPDGILWAAAVGDSKRAGDILADEPSAVNDRTPEEDSLIDRGTALHVAACRNKANIAKLLMAAGADINARDGGSGATALGQAAWRDNVEVMEVLLSGGADSEIKSVQYEGTPLAWAIFGGRAKAVELLLKHHVKVHDHAIEEAKSGQQAKITNATPADFAKVIELLTAAGAN